MPETIENAIIESVSIGYQDHGILSADVRVNGDGWGVAIGGYRLDAPPGGLPSLALGAFVAAFLKTLEISEWERLPGTMIRVKTHAAGSRVVEFAHPIKNKWCNIDDVMKEAANAKER